MIREFTDIKAWQEGHKLVIMIYKTTDCFPNNEKFGLIDQIKRAVVSVTSNIAEGFGRQGLKEKVQFYYQAHGSLVEVKNQLIISKDVGYLSESNYTNISEQLDYTHKLLLGLITKTKSYSRF